MPDWNFPHPTHVPCPTCGRGVGEVCAKRDGTRAARIHYARARAYSKALADWKHSTIPGYGQFRVNPPADPVEP